MTPEYVDEIIGLIDVDEWVGEDDFGYSVAVLPATEISPELWDWLEPAPEHTHLIAIINSTGSRTVITRPAALADKMIRTSMDAYEKWLEDLYVNESE